MNATQQALQNLEIRAALIAAGWLPPERVAEVEALLAKLNSGQVSALRGKPSKGLMIAAALTGAALRTLHGNAQGLGPDRVIQTAVARQKKRDAKQTPGTGGTEQ